MPATIRRLGACAALAAGCLDTPPPVVVPDAEVVPCARLGPDGSFDETRLSGQGRLILAEGTNGGYYTSPVVEAPAELVWSRLSWESVAPTLKPLPGDAAAEPGYLDGVDMTGNVLLLHLDEQAAGIFEDASPSGLDFGCGQSCPEVGQQSLFGTSARFGAPNQRIQRPTALLLEPESITVEAWGFRLGPHADDAEFAAGSMIARGYSASGQPYSSYSVEQVENHPGQPEGALRCYLGRAGNGLQIVGDSQHPTGFFHVACTYDADTDTARLIVNGELERTGALTAPIDYQGNPFTATDVTIGTWGQTNQRFNGLIDELAIFDRALPVEEIREHYLRGAMRVAIRLRTCDDPDCDGEQFVGPNGGPGTAYTERCNRAPGPPTDISPVNLDCDGDGVEDDDGDVAIAPARWAQLQIRIESDAWPETPQVISASLCAEP